MNSIKTLRYQIGLTQSDIAKQTGLSKAAVSIFENGKSVPTIKSASKIAQALDVTIDELFYSDAYEKQKEEVL